VEISRKAYRPDVQGLRAVAVGLVLLYHAGIPLTPGGFVGVDVFFVISGFLITSLLVDEFERTGGISLAGFYARRAKRLLPAAAVVLTATVALTLAFVPKIRWSEIGGDIVASALYVVNWRLADRSVDYLAEDSEVSPVLHFWSLAVEEQFYLVWPVLLLLVGWCVRRSRRRQWSRRPSLTAGMWVALAIVALPSLAWSVHLTANAPAPAFFVTTTRMWELAVGAAVALAIFPLARLPRLVAIGTGWAGAAAIIGSGLVFSTGSAWPGYAALLPTLGTAAVIAAGPAAGTAGPVALLGTAPFRWFGELSYSLYLWHWPLVAIAAVHWGGLSAAEGLLVVVLAVIPAWLTLRLVENPIRFSAALSGVPRVTLAMGASFSLASVAVGVGLVWAPSSTPNLAAAPALGASVLGDDASDKAAGAPVHTVAGITPDPLHAVDDVPEAYPDGCQQSQLDSDPLSCEYGDKNGELTVAIVGDSKILQWLPAFDAIAADSGWRLVTYTKSACPFASALVEVDGRPYETCTEWNANVMRELINDPPDAVFTSQGRRDALSAEGSRSTDDADALVDGLRASWSKLNEAGIDVVVFQDTPSPGMQVYECVSENLEDLTACTYPRSDGVRRSAGDILRTAAEEMPGVVLVDLNDAICPTLQCSPVIGNVLVYRQGSHLTATYVETLRPVIEQRLQPIVR
jgi:peptidoglycan/LPS O-acetylase OafA/YrhL